MHKFHVRIFRDSFNTPWGFRLQGGKDLNQPLVVQRVFSNTPAEGELQRGDIIVSIGDRRGEDLTHKQAKDLIEGGGGQISLNVQRPSAGQSGGQPQAPSFRTPAPVAPRTNPPKAMPYQGGGGGGGGSGHTPKKVNLSKLGGGGPDFGSDFSRPYAQKPMQSSAPSYRPVHQSQSTGQMLNRVQDSLDNIIYSPRTPEPYQSSPFYGSQPAAPPPFQPNMSMSGSTPAQPSSYQQPQYQQQQYQQQQYQQPQQQAYRPTFEQVDSGQLEESQEEFVPVWERRKTFVEQPSGAPRSTKRSTPVPKVPKPVAFSPEAPSFGTDYSKAPSRPIKWTPQRAPAAPPVNAAPVQSTPPRYQTEAETIAPWRESLRSTGVKPWDADLDYTSQQPAPRSDSYNALAGSAPISKYKAPSSAPAPSWKQQEAEEEEEDPTGPRVVHLQYNSPMGLYSQQNIKETKAGQTKKSLEAKSAKAQSQKPAKGGERDWSDSAVYRMIQQDERRGPAASGGPVRPGGPGGPSKPGAPPKPPAPKPMHGQPQYQPQAKFGGNPYEEEIGVSDF